MQLFLVCKYCRNRYAQGGGGRRRSHKNYAETAAMSISLHIGDCIQLNSRKTRFMAQNAKVMTVSYLDANIVVIQYAQDLTKIMHRQQQSLSAH